MNRQYALKTAWHAVRVMGFMPSRRRIQEMLLKITGHTFNNNEVAAWLSTHQSRTADGRVFLLDDDAALVPVWDHLDTDSVPATKRKTPKNKHFSFKAVQTRYKLGTSRDDLIEKDKNKPSLGPSSTPPQNAKANQEELFASGKPTGKQAAEAGKAKAERAPWVPREAPDVPKQIPTEPSALANFAKTFVAEFANAKEPVAVERVLPYHCTLLAEMAAQGWTVAEAWDAFTSARMNNSKQAPLLGNSITRAWNYPPVAKLRNNQLRAASGYGNTRRAPINPIPRMPDWDNLR